MSRFIACLVLVLAWLAPGCSNSSGPIELELPESCSAHITVQSGSAPVFDWSPSCSVGSLTVEELDGGEVVWKVSCGADPPVRYGVCPSGSCCDTEGAAQLVARAQYRVRLSKSGFLQRSVTVGTTIFTHLP